MDIANALRGAGNLTSVWQRDSKQVVLSVNGSRSLGTRKEINEHCIGHMVSERRCVKRNLTLSVDLKRIADFEEIVKCTNAAWRWIIKSKVPARRVPVKRVIHPFDYLVTQDVYICSEIIEAVGSLIVGSSYVSGGAVWCNLPRMNAGHELARNCTPKHDWQRPGRKV